MTELENEIQILILLFKDPKYLFQFSLPPLPLKNQQLSPIFSLTGHTQV